MCNISILCVKKQHNWGKKKVLTGNVPPQHEAVTQNSSLVCDEKMSCYIL